MYRSIFFCKVALVARNSLLTSLTATLWLVSTCVPSLTRPVEPTPSVLPRV